VRIVTASQLQVKIPPLDVRVISAEGHTHSDARTESMSKIAGGLRNQDPHAEYRVPTKDIRLLPLSPRSKTLSMSGELLSRSLPESTASLLMTGMPSEGL
jgi:hypothetical protein